jgi:YD repeat-containing protein
MQTCILKEIRYPTGGKTLFDYESNYTGSDFYWYTNTNNGIIGGLRIKSIRSLTDSTSIDTLTKSYKYDIYGATSLINSSLYTYQQNYTYIVKDVGITGSGATTKNIAMSNQRYPLTLSNASPIIYNAVTEYFGKDTVNNNGKIIYSYRTPLYYNYVYQPIETPRFVNLYTYDNGDYEPKLADKKIYKNNNGIYQPISELSNTYTAFRQYTFNTGLLVDRSRTYIALWDPIDYLSAYDYVHEFIYANTKAYTELFLLTQSTQKTYGNNNDSNSIVTTYQYDTTSLLPTVIKTISSRGDSIKLVNKYPSDYPAQGPYDLMVQKNILTPIVEQSEYSNNNFLKSTKTNYYNWGNGLIAPQTVESKKLTNNIETRMRFHAYDSKGNVLSVSKENDLKTSYIWGYNNSYPIAEVANADTSTIAYTSFEADGKGKWNYTTTPVIDSIAVTGKYIYTLNGSNNITRPGLTTSLTYIVSYWTRNSSAYSITGTISGYPIQGRTAPGGWHYFSHKITGQSSVVITGNGTIDELRLYPENAQMNTVTYYPNIGISSQCDVNNRITYYEYDTFGRLILIRDQNKNIVKQICYNYAGQAESCHVGSSIYYNSSVSQNFTSTSCFSGQVGVPISYSVAQDKYTSTVSQHIADSLALADVSANGQTYANTYGTCVCNTTLCDGSDPSYKCINLNCEHGTAVCVSSVFAGGQWTCTWYYRFSDCTQVFAYVTHPAFSGCTVAHLCR